MTRSHVARVARRLPERAAAGFASLALTGMLLVTVDARADTPPEVPAITVQYAEMNLDDPAKAASLYRRIKQAARKVCGLERGRNMPLSERAAAQGCYEHALARAVQTVDKPVLTALHRRAAPRAIG